MFCPLEKIELRVQTCPAKQCMYQGVGGSCHYEKLTADEVDLQDIAAARSQKLYVVRTHMAAAKASVTLGVTLIKYTDFIKDSFADSGNRTVNNLEDNQVAKVLRVVFNLTDSQQVRFWESGRFEGWAKRSGLSLTLSDVKTALLSTSVI